MQRILLLGTDYTDLGQTAVETLGPMAAALTRGRHPKAYPHLDPNEDALLLASDGDLHVMAVADGHNGTLGSHSVIQAIHDTTSTLADLEPDEAAAEIALIARDALVVLPPPGEDVPRSATTLSVVAIKGEAGAAVGWGDSAAVLIRARRARLLTTPTPDFRAAGAKAAPLSDPITFSLGAEDRVVTATDGLTDFLRRPWDRTLARLVAGTVNSSQAVEAAVAAAGDGGGGDNLAVCVFHTPPA